MLKKKLLLIAAALLLSGGSLAQAALTDPIRDMLASHTFLAVYREKQSSNMAHQKDRIIIKDQMEDNPSFGRTKDVLAEGGGRQLLVLSQIMEPGLQVSEKYWDPYRLTYILTYGDTGFVERVYMGKQGKLELQPYLDRQGRPLVTKRSIAVDKEMKRAFEERFRQYFLPLLPEENKTTLNGKEMPKVYSTDYAGSGTEVIGGTEYQYEEYTNSAPEGSYRDVTRYYFLKGELKRVVHDMTWDPAAPRPRRLRDTLVLDRFTGTFDDAVFIPPEEKKMDVSDFMGMNLEP